jgi:TPR repeat protein
LGQLLRGSKVLEKNLQASVSFFLSASEKSEQANYFLGEIYMSGEVPIEKDLNTALEFFKKSEQLGNTSASFPIGLIEKENGNLESALFHLQKSSKNNNIEATFLCGTICQELSTEQREIESIEYFKKAVGLNHSKSMLYLGYLFYKPKFIKKDLQESVKYLKMAGEKEPFSFHLLGEIELEENNIEKSLEFYQKAVSLEQLESILKLGSIYYEGTAVQKDLEKAKKFFKKASEKGNIGSFYILGEIALEQKESAIEYFSKASDLGEVNSCDKLGMLYQEGKHVKKDLKLAKFYFEKASKCGSVESLYSLGEIHLEENEINLSKQYFERASDLGHLNSSFRLAWFHYEQDLQNENLATSTVPKSVESFQKAAEKDHFIFLLMLGFIYYEGKIVQKKC